MGLHRKRAVLYATIPATSVAWFVPLVLHLHSHRVLPVVAIGYALCMAVPLVLAMNEISTYKQHGNS